MSQIARPIADISEGLWTPVPIYPQINGITAGPGVVTGHQTPVNDAFEVAITPLAWPSPGTQTLTVGLGEIGIGDVLVTIQLLQGSTVIASWQVTPSLSFNTALSAISL